MELVALTLSNARQRKIGENPILMEGVMQHRTPDQDRSAEFTMTDAYRVLEALGPTPHEVLAAMVDYGLSDVEISRYYRLTRDVITILRQHRGMRENL